VNLSVVILTFNEEANLPACLESLRALGGGVFVVDSGSKDRTSAVAEAYGAAVVEHAFESHAKQWSWALENLPLRSDWILGLDADQRLTPELAAELSGLLSADGAASGFDGFYIKRRQIFRGRWIRHGGYYPKYLLKLFRRGQARLDCNDLVDHHFYVSGPTGKLRHDLTEENRKEDDITFWIDKHNRYATLLAQEEILRSRDRSLPLRASLGGNPDQRSLLLKRLWRRLPLFVRPALYFFYRYFAQSGWLDGREGFVFHFLHAFWFRLLVDIKIDELRGRQPAQQPAARARSLHRNA